MVYIVFGIISTLAFIGILIDIFEILPTLSKRRGEKVEAPFRQKTRERYLEEYYGICKELNKPLFWYHYTKWFYKHDMHLVYIFVFVSFLSFVFAIL